MCVIIIIIIIYDYYSPLLSLFFLLHFLLPAKSKRGFESKLLKACLLGAEPRIGLLRGQSSVCPQSADMYTHLHTFLHRNTSGW